MNIEFFEENDLVPRGGDVWIQIATISPLHWVKFFIPRLESLFTISDKMVRIEHSRVESRALVWKMGKDTDGEWLWNFEHDEKV